MPTLPELSAHIPPAATGSYPVRGGNLVRPLLRSDAFRRIAEAIASAQHSVWLTVAFCDHDFRFPDGFGGSRLAGKCVRARSDGLWPFAIAPRVG